MSTRACPSCGFTYYWEESAPGVCDGCGHIADPSGDMYEPFPEDRPLDHYDELPLP